ncbi:MAG: TerD family protein, partial [Pseudomonadota bacterium]|nr:TerD family protein [Pseudomonadota bacterium]
MTFNTYQRGDTVALNLGESARKRLICGLRWDPMTDNSVGGIAARGASGVTNAFDLDLICLMFSKEGVFLGGVSGTEGEHVADNGNIYHTGDVVEGEDDHDDEQIIMELFNLSSKVHHIFLVAEVQSAHNFGQVE